MRFHTEGLLSKWGFGDGDMLDDLLGDNGFHWRDLSPLTNRGEYGTLLSFDHIVLFAAVAAYVIPVLDQKVEVDIIGCIHNPIRARTVDGVEVDIYGVDYPEGTLTPAYVDVPNDTLLSLARTLRSAKVEDPGRGAWTDD